MGLSIPSFLLHYVAVTCFVVVYGFMDETVDKAVKSEGYCSRILRAQGSTRKEGYNDFSLRVEGDPEYYKPGNTYRVSLSAASPAYFRGFTLIALKEGKDGEKEDDHAGSFQIIDDEDTQFMSNCPVAVTESTPRRRTRIQVFWTAPSIGTGCVILKASIVQKKIIYFQDEGSLTKRMCEQDATLDTGNEKAIPECCACGTAKYRLTFYGNWSEKSHPKDYPRRANHWSAIIGGSHSKEYVLWEYGGYASDGVKQVAEFGSPVKMEEEIRQKKSKSDPWILEECQQHYDGGGAHGGIKVNNRSGNVGNAATVAFETLASIPWAQGSVEPITGTCAV